MQFYFTCPFLFDLTVLEIHNKCTYHVFVCNFCYYLLFFEQVKVMVRICPSVGVLDSSESMSFLKVDQRKKQLTLYEPSLLTQPSLGHRHTPLAAPKMFAFDAVFTQDASQVKYDWNLYDLLLIL